MHGKAKKQSKREDARRKAAYVVSCKADNECQFSLLTETEASTLISAISSNCISRFGIVRLSTYDLNYYYPLTCVSNTELRQKLCIIDDQKTTLLDAACAQRSDQIVSSLLRAGASPVVYSGGER